MRSAWHPLSPGRWRRSCAPWTGTRSRCPDRGGAVADSPGTGPAPQARRAASARSRRSRRHRRAPSPRAADRWRTPKRRRRPRQVRTYQPAPFSSRTPGGTPAARTIPSAPYVTAPGRMVDACRGRRHPSCMSETEVAQNATYQSAERVLTLLKSFDDSRTELGVADIARALSRAQVDRLPPRRGAGADRVPHPGGQALPPGGGDHPAGHAGAAELRPRRHHAARHGEAVPADRRDRQPGGPRRRGRAQRGGGARAPTSCPARAGGSAAGPGRTRSPTARSCSPTAPSARPACWSGTRPQTITSPGRAHQRARRVSAAKATPLRSPSWRRA